MQTCYDEFSFYTYEPVPLPGAEHTYICQPIAWAKIWGGGEGGRRGFIIVGIREKSWPDYRAPAWLASCDLSREITLQFMFKGTQE
jgi:hypothetical protein